MASSPSHRVRIGAFTVDLRTGEVCDGSSKTVLQDQPLKILQMLAERPGEAVSRQDIQEKLWPNDTIVEFDHSIAVAIRKLRQAFADSADNPKYIETIARRGYRLIAALEAIASSDARGSQPLLGLPEFAGAAAPSNPSLREMRWLTVALLVCVASVAGGWYWRSRPSPPMPRSTLVLADFDNATGEPVFDATLREAMGIQLEQSPYLTLLPEKALSTTLKLMNRPMNQPLTGTIAREVCLRSNANAIVTGSISRVGDRYLLTAKAAQCATGKSLAAVQTEAANRNEVLPALSRTSDQLRRQLGESLPSLQAFSRPLEEATTSSLEALQAFSLGVRARQVADPDTVGYFQRAVQADPNFAFAHMYLGLSYQNLGKLADAKASFRKAYELRSAASQREQYYIEVNYFKFVTGELEKAMAVESEWTQAYEDDYLAHFSLGNECFRLGDYQRAAAEARKSVALSPNTPEAIARLMYSEIFQGRLDAATQAFEEASERHVPDLEMWTDSPRWIIAFLRGDNSSVADHLMEWVKRSPAVANTMYDAKADEEAFYGRLENARKFSQQALAAAERQGNPERIAFTRAGAALREAEVGNLRQAKQVAEAVLRRKPSEDAEVMATLTLARCGELERVRALARKLKLEYPESTMIQSYMVPTLLAAAELSRPRGGDAVKLLDVVAPLDLAPAPGAVPNLYPLYIRGLAFMKRGQAHEAAGEFQKLLDHQSICVCIVIYPLTRLQLARAQAMMGDKVAACKSYEDFLTRWKNADPDIPIYRQAQAEYAALSQ